MLSMHDNTDKCRAITLPFHNLNIVSNLFSAGNNGVLALPILSTTYKPIGPSLRGGENRK